MNTRFVLVEFWRASNAVSRINHKEMVLNPPNSTGGNLSIVSVSLDVKRDWWLTSAKDDKITWTQVSDLKGEDSPNVENWAVTDLPLYYLLDGNGRIISRDRGLFGVRKLLAEKSGTHPK